MAKATKPKTDPQPAPSPLVSVRQAAEALSVHEDTVRRLIDRGELTAVRVGRAVRVDLHGYLRALLPDQPATMANQRQLVCFHARADELDRARRKPRGTSKREAIAAVAKRFGRELESSLELTGGEVSFAIDWLTDRLGALQEADEAKERA